MLQKFPVSHEVTREFLSHSWHYWNNLRAFLFVLFVLFWSGSLGRGSSVEDTFEGIFIDIYVSKVKVSHNRPRWPKGFLAV